MTTKIKNLIKFPRAFIGALVFVFAGAAHAQIPVTDGAHIGLSITNQVESISKWTQQFAQLQQQIQQYQQQYAAITGARGMGGLLNNQSMNAGLPADWKNVLASIKSTSAYATERAKYPTLTDRPKTNAMYDVMASQNATMSDLYAKSNQRLANIQALTAQIDAANDPAAKSDLANRLISEQNAIQANQNLVTILQSKQKQDMKEASREAQREYLCSEFKRTGGC
jgi:type IV secretion system protein VirB5